MATKLSKELSKGDMVRQTPDTLPFQRRFSRIRLLRGDFDKVELRIEIYQAPKPNVLLFMEDFGRWLNFSSLEDLFIFLANNYTVNM
jgi:hypothetical protein